MGVTQDMNDIKNVQMAVNDLSNDPSTSAVDHAEARKRTIARMIAETKAKAAGKIPAHSGRLTGSGRKIGR